ncbi:MAG: hypothetical protein EOM23_07225, partial [Candidatus Moranbacteria bacterium]|nr:hypothetical protein [Candidatus Moranbacteria bacterium]
GKYLFGKHGNPPEGELSKLGEVGQFHIKRRRTKNLIHFDIKPDNILISPRGEALLSDFGLAKKTALCGLAEADEFYFKMCPPEAFSKHEFSTHFDIYQSGLTLYRMCVGDIVFYDQYYSYFSNGSFDRDIFKVDVRNSIFPDRDVLPIHIPQKLKATIKKCLHSDINHRFSSAIDVINELAGIEGNILDWECEYSDTDICYTKNVDDKKYELIVTNDKKSTATKQVNGGKKRTIPDYCLGNINNRSVYKFLVSH